jgi:hypothetical protein
MATDPEKILHRARLWGLVAIGMTQGIWDMVEESAASLSPSIGETVLGEFERQLGLEIAGEKPEDLLVELGRIFVDEYGYASEAKVEHTNEIIRVSLLNALGMPEWANLQDHGVEKLFSHPYLCTALAALARSGIKARGKVELDKAAKSQIVTFELL